MLVIAYFLGAAIVGENGVLAWGDYRRVKRFDSLSAQITGIIRLCG